MKEFIPSKLPIKKDIETNQRYVKKMAKSLHMACDVLKKELKFDISNG